MVSTGRVKDELSRLSVVRTCCRKVQVATLLRLAGGLRVVGGQVVIEASLDTRAAAGRLRADITGLYGHSCQLVATDVGGPGWVVRVAGEPTAVLARQVGLVDGRGRPVRGLPPRVVQGAVCDARAVWRAAFLARGSLTQPGRRCALEIICPSPQAGLALVGAARRFGVRAEARTAHGVNRVVIRDRQAIAAMLTLLGAPEASRAWCASAKERGRSPGRPDRRPTLDDAHRARSARAAQAASTRVARALAVVGDDAPPHLIEAGRLRLRHPHASLDELGRAADPPLSKDAIAGRLRRLLALADRRDGSPATGT